MKSPKALLIAVGALVLLGVGFFVFQGPKPIIEIKGETIVDIGPFPLLNTYMTSCLTVIVVSVVAYLATRKLNLIPSGLQNAVEAVMEAMYNVCINTAGEKNGRRFFPVVMTIFTYIWIANWLALLPFFGVIGTVEKVDAEEFHPIAVIVHSAAGMNVIQPKQDAIEFDKPAILNACAPLDTAPPGADKAEYEQRYESCITGQQGKAIAVKLDKSEGTNSGVAACSGTPGDEAYDECLVDASNTALEQLDADGKQLGILVPFFRSMNTDINSPLSIAIMAMIFVEFWGITTLGFLKYGSKFINFSSPINFFVGILELIAEIARLISFTFRLFGNMLAGEILLLVMTFLLPFLVAIPFYGLETFVGVIQAFVFAMLTLVFAVLAVSEHGDHEDHGEDQPGAVHIENIPAGVEPAHT